MSEFTLLPESALEPPPPDERAGKYLIFRLGNGEFGTAIHQVREVMEMQSITRVPNAPAFIAGVFNLRGKVVPVLDLRITFGVPVTTPTPQTCIVIVRVALASVEQVLGIIVDDVTEVIHLQGPEFLAPEEFQTLSQSGAREPVPYLIGVVRVNGEAKLLLDLNEVLNHLDLRQVPVLSAAA